MKLKHFKKIIDVWNQNYAFGAVPPSEVNKATIVAMDLYKNKRFIIHYMQPHSPYQYINKKKNAKTKRKKKKTLRRRLERFAKKRLSYETLWRIGGFLGMLPEGEKI